MSRIDLPTLITAHDELLSENLELRKQNEALQTQAQVHDWPFPTKNNMCGERAQRSFQLFPQKIEIIFFGKVAPFVQTHQKIIITLFPRKINQPTWQPKRHSTWIFQTVDYMVPLQGVNSSYLRGFHWNPVWSRWRVLEDLPRNCHRAWRVLQVLHLHGVRPKIWRKKVSIQSGPRQK